MRSAVAACILVVLSSGSSCPMPPTRRLLLTSDGLSTKALKDEFRRLLGDRPENKNVWYIPTAPLRDGMSMAMVERQVTMLKSEFGLRHVEIIDVEYVKGEKLRDAVKALGSLDVIWAEMGNTYALRHHLRDSGGDQLVLDALDAGALYVGSSAGSIVAGRTVQMAFWKDWDDKTAEGTIDVDWKDPKHAQGLDVGGGRSFFPHANGQFGRSSWQDAQAKKHGHTDHEVVKLADGQGFVIDGDKAYPVE
ncbi:unnamed protein product [Symbiodinium natans]|uniref:Uncharacterized protein n=1 Tax=Symbiodinium natans TaxID=878477 RepID=A0A812MA94_9DINO|nr:unnamed protein product [Symbiodinium natans]